MDFGTAFCYFKTSCKRFANLRIQKLVLSPQNHRIPRLYVVGDWVRQSSTFEVAKACYNEDFDGLMSVICTHEGHFYV